MKYRKFICATTLFLLGAHTGAANESLVIENVTVVSPELAQPLGNRHVFIRDGRIEAVSEQPIAASTAARRLDGTGKFLTPGIMDGHVHVSQAVGLPFDTSDAAIATLEKEFFAQQPRSYLYFGVTQVLDTANMRERVDLFAAQEKHPDIFRCGAAPVIDGYPLVFIDKKLHHQLFPDYIYEPANAREHPLPPRVSAAEHTPEAVVARIAASGARCVKVFIEDGFGGRTDWPLISAETLRRVRTAAHKHGLLLAAHANALDMQRIALSENVDLIVHGVWNWSEAEGQQGMPAVIADHLRSIRAKNIGYQATLRVLPGVMDLLRPDVLDDPMYVKVVPPALLAWYRTEPGQWFKREVFGSGVDAGAQLAQRRAANERWATSDQGMRALRHIYELGQPMLLGSDTPSAPTYGNQPGYDTYREMQLMAQAGIPLTAIFAAATINNARQFRLEKEYGTIERGKIANLLLLDGNPLASVEAWNRIDTIVLHGEPIERETLAADRINAAPAR
jgi:imidazolonepropionase-like amidohydrolase